MAMTRAMGWGLVGLASLAVAAAVYFGLERLRPAPQPPAQLPVAAPSKAAAEEPRIRYPVRPEPGTLPALDASDPEIGDALVKLLGARPLAVLIHIDGFVRRVVATIDNLPREKLALHQLPVRSPGGQFIAAGTDESAVLSAANYARYERYVRIAEAVDAKELVALYARFYPLFQRAYVELGYPQGYFNDRLVEIIDGLLAAPELPGPVRLVRPKVFYRFADPELERLPAGRKILVRIGPENSARVKWKLREIRDALTAGAPAR
ncbi:MAG: DUF3014 domain-containing protein [Burkholderiales bacterium]|nr:DUF3014 domain-containing protein [Burkholderiales bacterium]